MKSPSPDRKRKAKKTEANPSAQSLALPLGSARYFLVALALGALTLLAFSNSFQGGFVLDNRGLLLDPRIREATAENIALIFQHTYWWPTGEAGLYRPFTTLSYLFNYAVLGDAAQPAGYHSVNFLLHLGNVCLAYILALRLTRKFWPAAFIAAVWAVHPVLTESVTNIVGRADLLAAAGVLSGLLIYLKSREAAGWRRALWLAGLIGVTTLGVSSKESAVAILPLIVLIEFISRKEQPRLQALAFGCAATLLPIAALLYSRSAVLAASAPAEFPFTDNPIVGAGWWTGRLTAIKVFAHYLWLIVWPANLSCDYSYNQIPLAGGAFADWLAYGAVLGFAIGVFFLYRWSRTCFFFACFALLNFTPASNLLFPIGTIMAERLLYLPSLGLLACLVLAIYAVAEKMNRASLAPLTLCLIVTSFSLRTWIRNADWSSDLTIAAADVRTSPRSFKLHRLLAGSLFESDATHSNLDRVIEEQDKSLAILDALPPALSRPEPYRLAGYYYLLRAEQLRKSDLAQGAQVAYQRALHDLLRCLSIDRVTRASVGSAANPLMFPQGDAQAYFLLSVVYLRIGDPDKAFEAISQARTLDPLNPQVYRQLSDVLVARHRNADADVATMQENAIMSLQEGNWKNAAELTDRILQIDSVGYPAAHYLNALANLRLNRLDSAEKSAREAIRLDNMHLNPRTSYALGLILAEKKDFKPAAELLKAYLTALPNAPDAETARKQLAVIQRSAQTESDRP